ncbi:hypothetical protein B0H17DRAFT_1153703 [Mycena rosella]|uniref:Uncharacterized protein n=1 Tax=Mycena rosella TaxID=1033263 RepID=A0AAD7B3I8_MYCRO|nr:hypothetical protein B0H17DRAFT_1153703 [Mycena rosella]
MDWGDHVAQKPSPTSDPTTHGACRGNPDPPVTKPHGIIFGIGWHLSQEENKSLVYYTPRKKDESSPRLRSCIGMDYPGGAAAIQDVANREGVFSFVDVLDGTSDQQQQQQQPPPPPTTPRRPASTTSPSL